MDALLDRIRYRLTRLPRDGKRAVMLVADSVIALGALWGAFALRLGEPLPPVMVANWWLLPATVLVSLVGWYGLGMYRTVVRLMGARTITAVVKASAVSVAVYMALAALWRIEEIPRATYVLYFVFLVCGLGGIRYLAKALLPDPGSTTGRRAPVLIYGAGMAGVQLADTLQHSGEYRPVAFIDDARALQGTEIKALPVEPPERVPELVQRHGAAEIMLALPSTSRQRRHEIINSLAHLPVHVRTVPGLGDIVSGRSRVDELREVDVDDLLGRDPVAPDETLLEACIAQRSILVTGAGGSIGAELCRQILRRAPQQLVLLERNEADLYYIERELAAVASAKAIETEVIPVLGSVLDAGHMERVLRAYHVEAVYHAAAYKHVPLVEANCPAGVRNNVCGTLYAVQAAVAAGVRKFVLISTDKAVNPTNVMGASKRVAEQILQARAATGTERTCLSMVRFGNVLDSSGSVVPLFRRQIREGGPITVTHPEVTRYFMTIPEATQLVLQAGGMGQGGDVFLLDMGEPVRIVDLARRMIRLSGLTVRDEDNPDGDIAIAFTGLRPGEKLYEELLLGNDVTATEHSMISRARESYLGWADLTHQLDALEALCRDGDSQGIRQVLATLVDGYTPHDEPVRAVGRISLDPTNRVH